MYCCVRERERAKKWGGQCIYSVNTVYTYTHTDTDRYMEEKGKVASSDKRMFQNLIKEA